MNKSILNQEFSTDNLRINSKINEIIFNLENELSNILIKYNYTLSWKKYFSKDNKYCIIEFSSKNRETIDWLVLILEKLKINYSFINSSTLEFNKYYTGISNNGVKGKLCIEI